MTPVAAPGLAGPVFAPAQVFALPKPPGGDSAAARRLAGAMRQAADEVEATASAVTAAGAAAAEAAEAVTVAVRALQALRAVAAFLRPQVFVTAGLTDLEAYRQVDRTGHLDVPELFGHAATDVSYGAAGGRRSAGRHRRRFGLGGGESGRPVGVAEARDVDGLRRRGGCRGLHGDRPR